MATSTIDFSKFDFSQEQIRSFNELIQKAVLESPELASMHTFEYNIRNSQEIGFVDGSLGLLGKASQGCGTRTPDNKTLGTSVKQWSPVRWEVFLQFCWTDLESNFGRFLRKLGTDVDNLENTEFLAFMEEYVRKGITDMFFRFVWFNDTAAATVTDSPAGVFTDGTDVDYFNLFDGNFVQLADIVATTPARKTTIAANAEATYALQDSTLTNQVAYETFLKLVDDAPIELTGRTDTVVYMTNSIWKKVNRYLQEKSLVFELDKAINGIKSMTLDGYKLVSVPMWDKIIRTYQDNGTKYNSPHRMLMTTETNLPVGLEGTDLFTTLKIWHNNDTEYTNVKVKDALDSKVLVDELIQYGV